MDMPQIATLLTGASHRWNFAYFHFIYSQITSCLLIYYSYPL